MMMRARINFNNKIMKKNERKNLYWTKNGSRAYWTADLKKQVVFLSKDFLEGKIDNGYPYAYPYADNAPNEGIPIPASIKGMVAGKLTGSPENRNGKNYYSIMMPFTFKEANGTRNGNHPQLLNVFVKSSDVDPKQSSIKRILLFLGSFILLGLSIYCLTGEQKEKNYPINQRKDTSNVSQQKRNVIPSIRLKQLKD
jgi:hypothetical protein